MAGAAGPRFGWWRARIAEVERDVRVEVLSSGADTDDDQVTATATVRVWGVSRERAGDLVAGLWFDGARYWRALGVEAAAERAWVDLDMRAIRAEVELEVAASGLVPAHVRQSGPAAVIVPSVPFVPAAGRGFGAGFGRGYG